MSVIADLATAAQGMIARAKAAGSSRGKRILLNVQLLNGEAKQNVELYFPYGYSALPPAGGDVIAAQVGGVRDQLVALHADDPACRIRDLATGEAGISNAAATRLVCRQWGIEIATSGNVQIQADGAITITAPTINAGGIGGTLLAVMTWLALLVYNGHTHPCPGGTTGVPNQQMGAGDATANFRAS